MIYLIVLKSLVTDEILQKTMSNLLSNMNDLSSYPLNHLEHGVFSIKFTESEAREACKDLEEFKGHGKFKIVKVTLTASFQDVV